MNLTLKQIFELMTVQKRYVWTLSIISGHSSRVFIDKYLGFTDGGDEETPKTKRSKKVDADESLKRLDSMVSYYRASPGTLFEIILKTDANAPAAEATGPFRFTDDSAVAAPGAVAAPVVQVNPYTMNGLAGLGEVVPNTLMEKYLALQTERTVFEVDKATTMARLAQKEKELERREAETEKSKAKYDDNSEMLKNGITKAIGSKIEGLLGLKSDTPALAGAEAVAATATPEALVIVEIANLIEDKEIPLDKLEWMRDEGVPQFLEMMTKGKGA